VGRKSLTEEEKRLILERRMQGASIRDIAYSLNRSIVTVRKLLKQYGLAGQLAKTGRPSKRNEPISEEVAKKMSEIITEAASKLASEHFENKAQTKDLKSLVGTIPQFPVEKDKEVVKEAVSEHFKKEQPEEQEVYSELLVERRPIHVKLLKKLEDLGYSDVEQALEEFIELKEGKVGEIEKELIHWRTKAFDFYRKLEEKQKLINKLVEDLKELFENYNDDIGVI
jgi:transposase